MTTDRDYADKEWLRTYEREQGLLVSFMDLVLLVGAICLGLGGFFLILALQGPL